MFEVIFLVGLALVWLVFATIQDVKKTEIANWLNFSLIVFALGFRFFYSLFSGEGFGFFYSGLIGLGIFFVVGNALYYGRMFAGGDAKLMIALGSVLPFSTSFFVNLQIFIAFFFIYLLAGAIYGLSASTYFAIRNSKEFKREFFKRFSSHKSLNAVLILFGILIMVIGLFVNYLLVYLGIMVFVLTFLYLYAKSVDESCMVQKVRTRDLREGDWLYRNVKIGSKMVRANWEGLSKKDIVLLKKKKKEVVIRKGIAFAPVFLISFLILVYIYFFNDNLLSLFFRLFG